jgi:hypothetical protein
VDGRESTRTTGQLCSNQEGKPPSTNTLDKVARTQESLTEPVAVHDQLLNLFNRDLARLRNEEDREEYCDYADAGKEEENCDRRGTDADRRQCQYLFERAWRSKQAVEYLCNAVIANLSLMHELLVALTYIPLDTLRDHESHSGSNGCLAPKTQATRELASNPEHLSTSPPNFMEHNMLW